MQDLVIIGAGSFGEDMLDNIRIINEEEPRWNLLGFIDDTRTGEIEGVPILGNLDAFLQMDKHIQYFVAVLDSKVRERIMNVCRKAGFTGAVILGKLVSAYEHVTVGESSYIGYRTYLMDGVTVGAGVVIEHGGVIHAEATIGDYSTLRNFPVLGKSACVGKHNYLALRCTMDDNVTTPEDCRFQSGTVMLRSPEVAGEYAGIPGKLVRAFAD